jgi:hypothetical protein
MPTPDPNPDKDEAAHDVFMELLRARAYAPDDEPLSTTFDMAGTPGTLGDLRRVIMITGLYLDLRGDVVGPSATETEAGHA